MSNELQLVYDCNKYKGDELNIFETSQLRIEITYSDPAKCVKQASPIIVYILKIRILTLFNENILTFDLIGFSFNKNLVE